MELSRERDYPTFAIVPCKCSSLLPFCRAALEGNDRTSAYSERMARARNAMQSQRRSTGGGGALLPSNTVSLACAGTARALRVSRKHVHTLVVQA